ncbi:MAG: ABC transporter ATP-binding protein [Alphaproteobacteria bacterium]|nr:ABC transporter ATP-binding protein [Alphaproteobacteria bacterium]
MRLIAGLEPVDTGEIHLSGERVSGGGAMLATEARRIGMVFQDYSLFPHLTAGANVAFGLDKLDRAERDETALKWLDRVGLKHRANAYPHELSGGEQQRVALARALAPKPRAILLDEPFSGLDAGLRAELRDATLATLAETRTTTLFVTHDAEDALQAADRIVIMKAGRVLQEGVPREVYDRPTSLDAASALGPVNVFKGIVSDGAIATPFGLVRATHLADGTAAIAVVRAEALTLSPSGEVRVAAQRPHGAHDLVRVEAQGVTWRALTLARQPLGETVSVEIQPAGAFAFSA